MKDYVLTNESNWGEKFEKDKVMSAENLLEEIEKIEEEIMYEKERMKHCAYGRSDMYYLHGLEERLIELNTELAEAEDDMEVEIMNEIKVTEEMKQELMDTYEGNKEMLYEMEEFLNNNGYLDNGVSDIHETFEMGYNNALQYVFGLLGITDYEKVK